MKTEAEKFTMTHNGTKYVVIAMPFGPGYPADVAFVVMNSSTERTVGKNLSELTEERPRTLDEATLSKPLTAADGWQRFIDNNLIERCLPHLN